MGKRFATVLLAISVVSLLSVATSQIPRVGAKIGPGTTVELPTVTTLGGDTLRQGVPTVVIFAKIHGCPLCTAVGEIANAWMERYPEIQLVVAETGSVKVHVEEWFAEHGVPIVLYTERALMDAFDTDMTLVYLLDENGVVREKARPQFRQQWVHLDRQLARAAQGDWDAVDEHALSLPPVGGVVRSSPSVLLGDGSPTVVLIADGYCHECRDFVSRGLQAAISGLVRERPGLKVYLLEPARDSVAEGFYGTPTYDYGPRAVFEEFAQLFGETAAGDEIMNYLGEGTILYTLLNHVWPDTGWANAVKLIRYEVGGPDDPLMAWGYGERTMGLLVMDGEGRYLGPVPFFTGSSSSTLASTVNRLLDAND